MNNNSLSLTVIFSEALDFVKRNFKDILKAYLVIFVILIALFFIPEKAISLFTTTLLITFLVTIYFCEKNNRNFDLNEIINAIKDKFLLVLVLSIIVGVINLVGLFLLIIPGIYCLVTFQFSIWSYLFKEDVKLLDSITYSKKLLEGRWWQVFGISLALIFALILVYIAFGTFIFFLSAILGAKIAGILASLLALLPLTLALSFQMYFFLSLEKTKSE